MSNQCQFCGKLIPEQNCTENSNKSFCSADCFYKHAYENFIQTINEHINAAKAINQTWNNPGLADEIKEIEEELSDAKKEEDIHERCNRLNLTLISSSALANWKPPPPIGDDHPSDANPSSSQDE